MKAAWRPSSGWQVAEQRAKLKARIREYFAIQNVLEVDTPSLMPAPPADPNIESLIVKRSATTAQPLYLHTSPEYAMKRLLVAGYPDIFSMCRVYRDGEVGRSHQPEFTMVEWYRLGFNLDQIIADTVALINSTLQQGLHAARITYRDACLQHANFDPQLASITQLRHGADENLRSALGDDRDGWLDLLFSTKVAPNFSTAELTVVTHYPISQAALSQASPADESVAERFEVFCGERELANGYVELQDAKEFVNRQHRDHAIRRANQQPVHAIDQEFLAAMQHGLPQCAGVAMGFERLHMHAAGASHIRDVIPFEFRRST